MVTKNCMLVLITIVMCLILQETGGVQAQISTPTPIATKDEPTATVTATKTISPSPTITPTTTPQTQIVIAGFEGSEVSVEFKITLGDSFILTALGLLLIINFIQLITSQLRG